MEKRIVVRTDPGVGRTINQDSGGVFVVESLFGKVIFALVCDGMGGLSEGEVASRYIVELFEKWFMEQVTKGLEAFSFEKVRKDWRRLIEKGNSEMVDYASQKDEKIGTTCSAILMVKGRYLIGHVGDSRIYELGMRKKLLTKDHTVVAREVECGAISYRNGKKDLRRHILFACIGAMGLMKMDFVEGKIIDSAIYLLCTDGFYRQMKEKEWSRRMDFQMLFNRIKARGERDNISVISIRV